MNREMRGCSPTGDFFKGWSKEEIAERCTPIVLQALFLVENRKKRYSSKVFTETLAESNP
jgi:hypothetical protein